MNSDMKPLSFMDDCFMDELARHVDTTDNRDASRSARTTVETKVADNCVVGVETYRAWIAQLSSSLPVTLAVENTNAFRSHCRDLREQLRKMPMPAAIDNELRRQLSVLCQQGPVTVRSSVVLDSKQGVSDTDTHDNTYTGVVGIDAVIARIIDCFVSTWQDDAVKTRSERGVDPASISMTVVVKPMTDKNQIQCNNTESGSGRRVRRWM